MDRKYRDPSPSESLALIGDNFITEHLFNNFKRYSRLKVYLSNSIDTIEKNITYIIDSSFNEKSQNDTLKYSVKNGIKKVVIVNHWKKFINEFKNITIVQAIVPDIYGEEHTSFNRSGPGNNQESPISYCNLICESIRRIHEAKIGFIPNVYISYGEEIIKYLHVDNLYEPIQHILDNINDTSEYEIYDEYRNVGTVLETIKETIEYRGYIEFVNNRSSYSKSIKRLPYEYSYKSLSSNIRNIYKHLLYNNERFTNY